MKKTYGNTFSLSAVILCCPPFCKGCNFLIVGPMRVCVSQQVPGPPFVCRPSRMGRSCPQHRVSSTTLRMSAVGPQKTISKLVFVCLVTSFCRNRHCLWNSLGWTLVGCAWPLPTADFREILERPFFAKKDLRFLTVINSR